MAIPELSEQALRAGLHTQFVGQHVQYFPVISSTQNVAKEAAHHGAPEGAVFIADEQTEGHGRLARPWKAPQGTSLLLSVVLRPHPEIFPKLVIIGSLAVALAIEEATGIRADFKWPNDILVHEKKVAGLLVEGEFQGDVPRFAILGIGINVNLDPAMLGPEVLYPATSLMKETGEMVSRLALAHSLLRNLERIYVQARDGEPVHRLWHARLSTLGKEVRIRQGNEIVEGIAEDVDIDGSLLLRGKDGVLITVMAGDVTLQA